MPNPNKFIHIRISDLLDARIRAAADWSGVNQAQFVKNAVTEKLNEEEAKRARIEKIGTGD